VREVAVHLQDELGAVGQGAAESVQVGAAEALLARPVEHVHPVELGREAIRDLAGPVRRAVVDYEHAIVGAEYLAERPDHRLEVLALVVRGQADGGA
jgi:hypothetical protein